MAEEALTVEQAAQKIDALESEQTQEQAPQESQGETQPEIKQEEPTDAVQETQGQESAPQEIQISDINDLAEDLGVEAADLYQNLTMPVNVGGETRHIALGEAKDAYRSSEVSKAEQQELTRLRSEFEKQRTDATGQLLSRLKEADGLLENAEKMLLADMEKVNWAELRESDPAEYAARRQEANEKLEKIKGAKAEIAQKAHEQHQEQQHKFNEQMQIVLEKEKSLLRDKVPEWRDAETAEKERQQLTKYLRAEGWNEVEINNMVDHRAIVALRKAMLWDELQKAQPEKKKVTLVGKKIVKPGKSQTKAEQLESDYRHDLSEFRKRGGSINDAAAMIEKHFLGET